MKKQLIIANFGNEKEKYVSGLDQYDYGQVLRIQGLNLPTAVEIHFGLEETGGTTVTRVGTTKDGVTDVVIPDSMLENGDIDRNYMIYVFVYLTDDKSGETIRRITMKVDARSKPEAFDRPEDAELFREAIKTVNESAARSEESEKQAEGWAHGREDLPERAKDNAKYYSDQAKEDSLKTDADRKEVERLVESVSGIDRKVALVKDYSDKAQTSATNAALSEQAAKESENNAAQAKEGAEAAQKTAEKSAQKTTEDRTAVESAKGEVLQAKTDVEADRKVVEGIQKDVSQTGNTIQEAVQEGVRVIENAGIVEKQEISRVGTTQKSAVESAGVQAVENINFAKQTAIDDVQAEGTTQIGNVTAEGTKQVQGVQAAAQEIIADREQIQTNKTDIADLRQGKADAIVEIASGTLLNIKDSSGAFFENFSMHGKTTQDGTPTPDVFVPIVNAGESGNIEAQVTGKNLLPFPYLNINEVGKTVNSYGVDYTVLQDRGVHLKGTPTSAIGLTISKIPFEKYGKITTNDTLFYDNNNNLTFFFLLKYIGKAIDMVVYPQVEHGTVATKYEPYKEPQTVQLQLDKPLTKWDRIEKRDGVWGIVRQGETKVLKAAPEEEWAVWEDKKNAFFIMNDKIIKEGLCSHFEAKGSFEIGKETGISMFDTIHLIVTDMNINSLENWKTWLQANPITVTYKTAKETWEPLPQETQLALNNLHTNYPTTIISNSEDCDMEVEYIADTKNYIDKQMQAIVTKQTETDRLILERTM